MNRSQRIKNSHTVFLFTKNVRERKNSDSCQQKNAILKDKKNSVFFYRCNTKISSETGMEHWRHILFSRDIMRSIEKRNPLCPLCNQYNHVLFFWRLPPPPFLLFEDDKRQVYLSMWTPKHTSCWGCCANNVLRILMLRKRHVSKQHAKRCQGNGKEKIRRKILRIRDC